MSKDNSCVLSTWGFKEAVETSWEAVVSGSSAVESCVSGCRKCQELRCDSSVGWGGSPNEVGETTLDSMIMNGDDLRIGCVGSLRNIKDAIGVAHEILTKTSHSMLVGSEATNFAVKMGYELENLSSDTSLEQWREWKKKGCIPNFWANNKYSSHSGRKSFLEDESAPDKAHDTIGIIVIDKKSSMAAATSTNGAKFKIPGRVGDSPIPGSGCYANSMYGGAAATGDGDILMRFLPSFQAIEYIKQGYGPDDAAKKALLNIIEYEKDFDGALVVLTNKGRIGAASYGFKNFKYSYASEETGIIVRDVNSISKEEASSFFK